MEIKVEFQIGNKLVLRVQSAGKIVLRFIVVGQQRVKRNFQFNRPEVWKQGSDFIR